MHELTLFLHGVPRKTVLTLENGRSENIMLHGKVLNRSQKVISCENIRITCLFQKNKLFVQSHSVNCVLYSLKKTGI